MSATRGRQTVVIDKSNDIALKGGIYVLYTREYQTETVTRIDGEKEKGKRGKGAAEQ